MLCHGTCTNVFLKYINYIEKFRKDQDQEKTTIPRVTDEGWNSQKQLSGPVEKKMKEKHPGPVSSSKAISPGPVGFFTE